MRKWELTKSIIPQPEDDRFDNQVVRQKKWQGFANPIEGNQSLIGPDPENPWPPKKL